MSMLAEPRRRQKWSLNPRGTDWANDDNKFGQKLMEKMGWSKGKGLGREEQGMKEHISLRFKDNSKGLGYKGNDDEWVKHYEGFEDVLATLNSEHNSAANSKNGSSCNSFANSDEDIDQKNKKSLEARSKVSKARVHYHKFTRGKDLSRYNKDDIACILGSKRAKKLAEAYAYEDSTIEVDEIGHVENLNGVTTIKGCTMQDYFEQKMAALKRSALPELQTTERREEGEKELLWKPGFGSGLDINCSNVSLKKGEVEEKKPEKDDMEEMTSRFTKKRKNKYALKGEDEERKKANQDIEPQKKEEEMEEHLQFNLEVEENLSFETKKSVKRKTTNDDTCGEYYPLSRNPFEEMETDKIESKNKKKKKKREVVLEDELVEDKVCEMISMQNPELNKIENKSEVCDEMVLEFKVTKGETHSSLKKKKSELSSPCTKGKIEETIIENIEQSANMKQNKTKKRNKNWEEDILQKNKEEGASENNRKDKKKKKVKYEETVDSSFFEAQNIQLSLESSKKKKIKHAESEDQTPKQDTEGMHDVSETIVENIEKCANTNENKAKKKKKKKKFEGEDDSQENEVKETSECNMKHKKKQKSKNEVIDASLFVEAQSIQQSVKSNKKKKKFRQGKDAMQDGQEAVEVEKKADHEEVFYAPQLGEIENCHESLEIKIKENTSKSKHSDLGYGKQTIKQDTESIFNTEENVDFHGKQEKKKSKKKNNNHVEETNKPEVYDRAVIGLSFDSQQLKRKNRKDRGSYHNEKHFEEVNHVICDVSDKCSKNSDEAEKNESSENPDAQLDKTGSIMNDAKKPKDWLALDFIDFSKSRAFPEEIESMKIRAKRQTRNIDKILSKMNFSNKTLREKPLCFSESFGSPESFNRPSFQCPGKNENVSLDYMDKNMEDIKNRYALETDHTSDRFSKKGTAVQNTSLGSEQFSEKEIGEKSRSRVLDTELLDTEFNKVGSTGRKFDNGEEFLENRKKNLHFVDKIDFDTGNCDRNTQHFNVSDGSKRLYSSYAERSVRGTGPNRSHNIKTSCRGKRIFPKKEFHDYFRDEKELNSAARAFKGANIWKCIGYKI